LGKRKSHVLFGGGRSHREWIFVRRIIVQIIPPCGIITHLLTGVVAPYLPPVNTVMIARQRAWIVLFGQMRIVTGVACIYVSRIDIKSPLSFERLSNVTQEVRRTH
jgi:hypothetical protein